MGRRRRATKLRAASRALGLHPTPLAATGFEDRQANAIAVLKDAAVPIAKHSKPSAIEIGGAARVVLKLIGVLVPVEFDHEARLAAEEVKDVGREWRLTAPTPIAEAAVSKDAPQARLGARAV